MRPIFAVTAFSLAAPVASFTFNPSRFANQRVAPLGAVNGIWNTGNDFGKGKFRFYEGRMLILSRPLLAMK